MRRRARRWMLAGALVTSAMAAGVAYTRYAARRLARDYPVSGKIVGAGGASIHVAEAGDGPAVVLIHGADGVLLNFTRTVVEELSKEFRSLAPDRPGHGYSTLPPGETPGVEMNARLLREAVRALGVEDPILVGHSYGAAVALRWALDHPDEVRGIVLTAPAVYPDWPGVLSFIFGLPAVPVLGRVLGESLVAGLGRPIMRITDIFAFGPGKAPAEYRAFSRAFFLRPAQFAALAEEYRTLGRDQAEMAPRYQEVNVPVIVIGGDSDRVTPHRKQAAPLAFAIPGAELRLLPGVGHEMQWAAPEEIVQAVRDVAYRAGLPAEQDGRGAT